MYPVLAMHSRDLMISGGMLSLIIGAVYLIVWAKLWPVRIGLVASGAAFCLGLAYFGFEPFFGGSHDPGTYFGCAMLCMGFISGCVLAAIEAATHRDAAEIRGFPVQFKKDDQE